MNAARLKESNQEKTYKEVLFHCGSTEKVHGFTKTLGLVMQKVVSDLKNPQLIIKMLTDILRNV